MNKSDEEAVKRGCYFDPTVPERIKQWIESNAIQSKAPFDGKPLSLLNWQYDELIRPIYGWYRPERGPNGERLRRFTRALVFLARRQGKTALMAALGLVEMLAQKGSEVISVASTVDQALSLYNFACDYVELGPLHEEEHQGAERFWLRRHLKTIEDRRNRSKFQCVSAEPTGKSSKNISCLIADEVCEWSEHDGRVVWDRLTGSMANRVNPLTLVLSSANFSRQTVGFELFQRAKGILSGEIIDPYTLPLVYSLDESKDWKDEANWIQCLPSLRTDEQPNGTCDLQFFRDEFEKAKGSAADEIAFRTWYLTQFVGSASAWVSQTDWDKCHATFDESELYGEQVVCSGLDLSMKGDLCALTVIVKKDDLYYLCPRIFSPEQLARQKEKADRIPIASVWSRNPEYNIYLTSGNVIDPSVIKAKILEDQLRFGPHPVRYDPWGAELFRQDLEAEGVEMIEVGQHPGSMSEPTGFFERLIKEEKIRINKNPCADWCIGNCVPRIDQHERVTIDKVRSRGRIDFVVSSIIGLSHFLTEQEPVWDGPLVGVL